MNNLVEHFWLRQAFLNFSQLQSDAILELGMLNQHIEIQERIEDNLNLQYDFHIYLHELGIFRGTI